MLLLTFPLPLDLHVLSLSLAFILSQDQTLRCFLYCLFFFSKNQTKLFVFVLPSQYHRISFLLLVFTPRFLWIDRESFLTLVLLRLLQLFQCPFCFARFSGPKTLQRYNKFLNWQNFCRFFFIFFILGLLSAWPLSALVLKSECKGRYFYVIKHIFEGFSFLI